MTDAEIVAIRKSIDPSKATNKWGDTLAFARALLAAAALATVTACGGGDYEDERRFVGPPNCEKESCV